MKHKDFAYLASRVLDRRWIALLGLALLVGLAAACSGQVDDADESSAASSSGRWTLPTTVKTAGSKVHITYVNAPKWTSASACGGSLLPGSRVLGNFLMGKFEQVSSVGGYSCRRNTADTSRMSVHGTGRALDVFIPEVKGGPDSAQGDKVANWLVENATAIGVQLIIWDRTMWRANGTNDVAYGGPIPHIDHIHVEITQASAAKTKQWFSDNDAGADDDSDAGADASDMDADTDADATATGDASTTEDASTTTPDAAPPPPKDAGSTTTAPDAATPPAVDAGSDDDDTSDQTDYGGDSAGDEAGEESSLPDYPGSRATPEESEADIKANAGCSAAKTTPSNVRFVSWGGLAIALGTLLGLRRKKR